ncbi:protein TILLER ANGLE CONTROL 1 [Benincasa hispida]|uniref:protein TILLER ANGLE CONTROL 1 n=1 Tax=Benincasa hispida TaxID=102211 RepID=UPI0018FF97BA|nr:protein TILLER ANGLE CONTROL 1 [Benincasa hispida]
MKIFNWVHKTFHHTLLKEGFAQNGTKKNESSGINEVDRHALLKQVEFDHVETLHDWRDGILTIGTFGFESLKPSNEQKEYLVLESEEDDYEDKEEEEEKSLVNDEDDDIIGYLEDEELNPLMFTAFGHKSKDVCVEKGEDLIIGAYESKYSGIMEMENEEKKKKGERRITLADLFLADARDVAKALEDDKVLQKKTADVRSKSGLSFAKKLIPRVKEDSHPIKNFQRLMRRMLKKKIHPEIEDKINKASPDLTHQIGMPNNGGFETFESLSLLPTQDAIV